MNNFAGKFITLEGTEGAGKSTNLSFIEDWLSNQNIEVVTTREPGGTQIGEAVREILLNTKHTEMTPETELMLMFSARNQHIQEKIIPALKAGKWVVSDRFTDASYAYQGAARGIEYQRISELEQWVQQGFHPDMTFVFDLSIEEGMKRVKSRGEKTDRFEQEQKDFFEKVRKSYLHRASQSPKKYTVLDASNSLNRVQQQIEQTLKELI
jgi:dTMP kinase